MHALKTEPLASPDIVEIENSKLKEMSGRFYDIHMNWQNDLDYISKLDNIHIYAVTHDSQIVSFLAIDEKGKVYLIWTHAEHRFKGFALALIHHAKRKLNLEKMTISFPNNATLTGFVQKIGFKKESIYQYEMYALL